MTDAVASAGIRTGRGWKDAKAPFAAAALVLTASFGNFLSYHDYSFLCPEVGLVEAAFLLIATLFAATHRWAGNFGKSLLDGALVYLAVDLNSDYLLVAAGAAAVAALLRLSRNISLLEPLSIMSLVILATAVTGLTERRPAMSRAVGDGQQPGNGRPAVLHLILDEHGGLGGITDPRFRQEVAAFFRGHGFRLFEKAYSRHFQTINAVPDVLNFGHPGDSRKISEALEPGKTEYLSALAEHGYRLNIYQSEFADFCQYHRFATCTSTWTPSVSFLEDEPVATIEKARLLAIKFAALSSLAVTAAAIVDLILHLPGTRQLNVPLLAPKQRAVSSTLGAYAALEGIAADVKVARRGNVYFAHVLAPHYPYMRTSDCTLTPPSKWAYRRINQAIAYRRSAYREQIGCVHRHLANIIRNFEASPAGKDGIIVIHGDHGSRITEVEPIDRNRGKIKSSDLMAGYSTLFAVRAPGIEPGVDRRQYASPVILKQLLDSRFSSVEGMKPGSGVVYLDGANWTVGSPVSLANAWPSTAN